MVQLSIVSLYRRFPKLYYDTKALSSNIQSDYQPKFHV